MYYTILLAENLFVIPPNASCACPGDVLTFTCSVIGGNATIWGGSAFDCAGNEITLRHRGFIDGTARGECNDGAILGQSLPVIGNCHTSKLNVTITTGLNNKTVECYLDSVMQRIGQSLIKVAGKY